MVPFQLRRCRAGRAHLRSVALATAQYVEEAVMPHPGAPRRVEPLAGIVWCSLANADMLQIYSFWRSIASFRVRVALKLKGLPFEEIPIDILSGE
jgi:hypothetical protein